MRADLGIVLVLALAPDAARSQARSLITVRSAVSHVPLANALVRAVRLDQTVNTDRLGRAWFVGLAYPETLIVAAVGFRPDTVEIHDGRRHREITLRPAPLNLAALTITDERSSGVVPSTAGRWEVTPEALYSVPFAVQADAFRALSLVPSISFSSPLSARPIIRGYDAAENVLRIDGFEIINPYHLGRIYSSFSASAVASVTVTPIAWSSADGGTLVGVVDVVGRGSTGRSIGGGVDLDLVSASAWFGSRVPTPLFGSGRAAFLDDVTAITGDGIPYNFRDVYGRGSVSLGGQRALEASLFASDDDFSDRQTGMGMDWSNVLLGSRSRLIETAAIRLDASISINRFRLVGTNLEARNSRIDFENRFNRLTGGVSATAVGGPGWARVGVAIGRREIVNTLDVRAGDDFDPFSRHSLLTEINAFAETRVLVGPVVGELGLRLDASPDVSLWQPRARVSAGLTRWLVASVAISRGARLYQIVTDAQPEPTIAFNDFWFNAGQDNVPVPHVDQVSLGLNASGRQWSAHAAGFVTGGRGLGELRPLADQTPAVSAFRFGNARTRGFEGRFAFRTGGTTGASVALTYVLSESERRWDDGSWRPWRLDRRHTLRVQSAIHVAPRWTIFGSGELQTGQPITPVSEVVWRRAPPLAGDTAAILSAVGYRFGPEGAARSAGTLRIDLGGRATFGGSSGARLTLGLSVINVTFGDVAPEVPVPAAQLQLQDGTYPDSGVPHRRLFSLPAVPSLTIRLEF